MILKLVDAINQMSTWSFMNIKGQGHPWTFVQGHSDSTFSNVFSLETPRRIEAKFHEMWGWNWGLCHHDKDGRHVHIWYKTFIKLLLLNQKADELQTWSAALVTQVLPNLFKWWPWVDLDLFYSKVKFGPFCFCMGKCLSFNTEACEVNVDAHIVK